MCVWKMGGREHQNGRRFVLMTYSSYDPMERLLMITSSIRRDICFHSLCYGVSYIAIAPYVSIVKLFG